VTDSYDAFGLSGEEEERVYRRVRARLYAAKAREIAAIYLRAAERCEAQAHLWAERGKRMVVQAHRWFSLAERAGLALAKELDERERRLTGAADKEAA